MKYQSFVEAAEYSTVLRLAEQYLIRAEARAQLGKLSGDNSGESDINIIRSRAGLSPISAGSRSQMVEVVEKERKAELFCEWGHRWFDLNRTGRTTAVLNLIKPSWHIKQMLFPIPEMEIRKNQALTQNSDY